MVMISDLLVMVGLPVLLFVLHRLWPEAVEGRKNAVLMILVAWFLYTFFGSRLIHGDSTRFVIFSAAVVAVLGVIMFLIIKNFPDHARKYDKCFRVGFMIVAAVAALAGWRFFG